MSLPTLDFRFGFSTATPGCSLVYAGQIISNSGFDPSNFIAIDDPDTLTLSVINRFAPSFDLVEQPVPEPATLGALFVGIAGLRLARAMSRRTRR